MTMMDGRPQVQKAGLMQTVCHTSGKHKHMNLVAFTKSNIMLEYFMLCW